MTHDRHKKYQHVISTIGEEKVIELYDFLGPEKISMAALQKIIIREKIGESLNGKKPISRLASEHGVSRMTIYRQLKRK